MTGRRWQPQWKWLRLQLSEALREGRTEADAPAVCVRGGGAMLRAPDLLVGRVRVCVFVCAHVFTGTCVGVARPEWPF